LNGLAGRFRWLLEAMMRLQGIDVEELDEGLGYGENKAEIESRFMTGLVPKLDKLEEELLQSPRGKSVPWQVLEDARE
jgi:hypothetical protein